MQKESVRMPLQAIMHREGAVSHTHLECAYLSETSISLVCNTPRALQPNLDTLTEFDALGIRRTFLFYFYFYIVARDRIDLPNRIGNRFPSMSI